jgi:hypothetical protein
MTYKVCLKSNATGAIIILLTTELKINILPFNIVPMGSHTPPKTLFPLLVAVLVVQDEVRLPHSYGHAEFFMPSKNLCPRYSVFSINPF